MTKLKTKCHLF